MTLTDILLAAWSGGFTTKSDLARTHATLVGVASSEGYITTKLLCSEAEYHNVWLITVEGLRLLEHLNDNHQ
ncbi:hypothetical protein [Pyruvatibacter sp.]